MLKKKLKKLLLLITVNVFCVTVCLVGLHWYHGEQQAIVGTKPAMAEQEVVRPADITGVVKRTAPAVVKIETVVEETVNNPFLNDPFFREFFKDQLPKTQVRTSLGSGFIVSPDGYIITNSHVVEGAKEIVVVVAEDSKYQARLVGNDQELDLAVLKIDGHNLPHLKLGNSDSTEVGEWVIAIGNPYGLDHTVTVGVISAKGRPVNIENRRFRNLLQTDASINPGNSGGPLINLRGEVIGVNTAINAKAQGIGFAIPSSTIDSAYKQLITKGVVSHPYIGVYLQQTQDAKGVLVVEVASGSPAEQAGIKQQDLIVKFNGRSVTRLQQFTDMVAQTQPGEKVKIIVNRAGYNKEIEVIVGDKSTKRN